MKRRSLGLALAVALLANLVTPGLAAAGDPWYSDVSPGSWYYEPVRVLWEAGATDGYRPYHAAYAYYNPEQDVQHQMFTVLLTKVFGYGPLWYPHYFRDVAYYTGFYHKTVEGYLNRAAASGLTPQVLYFHPYRSLERQQAVSELIGALDLTSYANNLSWWTVEQILRQFRDGRWVLERYRKPMAAAILLGIIKGYPDHSIRPGAVMSRAEATTIIYRSTALRLELPYHQFSPDGDGFRDTLPFTLRLLRNRQVQHWQVQIRDQGDHLVWSEDGHSPPGSLVWNGSNQAGSLLPTGTYWLQAAVEDHANHQFQSVRQQVRLIRRTLSASVTPARVQSGRLVTLTAYTSVEATVSAKAGNTSLHLHRQGSGWTVSWPARKVNQPTHVKLEITADFGVTKRQLELPLTILPRRSLSASVNPNPLAPPAVLTISATVHPDPKSVSVKLPSALSSQQQLDMKPAGNGQWQVKVKVPATANKGRYRLTVTAHWRAADQSQTVPLMVRESPLNTVVFTLEK